MYQNKLNKPSNISDESWDLSKLEFDNLYKNKDHELSVLRKELEDLKLTSWGTLYNTCIGVIDNNSDKILKIKTKYDNILIKISDLYHKTLELNLNMESIIINRAQEYDDMKFQKIINKDNLFRSFVKDLLEKGWTCVNKEEEIIDNYEFCYLLSGIDTFCYKFCSSQNIIDNKYFNLYKILQPINYYDKHEKFMYRRPLTNIIKQNINKRKDDIENNKMLNEMRIKNGNNFREDQKLCEYIDDYISNMIPKFNEYGLILEYKYSDIN